MKTSFLLILLLLSVETAYSQTVEWRGYLKTLSVIQTGTTFSPVYFDHILHHRNEWTWSPTFDLEFRVDIRTRLFNGYNVRTNPIYTDFLNQDRGWIDLTLAQQLGDETIFQSAIDRLSVSYYLNDLHFSAGRQRLNWSKTTIWSPNDLFNNFAFLDFDYEERPGTDALAIQYPFGFVSSLEAALQWGSTPQERVVGVRFESNFRSYDVQLISGWYRQFWAFGMGWSGYLGNAGFQGEWTTFIPEKGNPLDDRFSFVLGSNYMFSNQLFTQVQVLYNSAGSKGDINVTQLLSPPFASNLFPSRYALYTDVSAPFTPLFSWGLGILSSVSDQLFITIPQLTYSLSQNIDVLFLAQLFYGESSEAIPNQRNALFLRLKWSY